MTDTIDTAELYPLASRLCSKADFAEGSHELMVYLLKHGCRGALYRQTDSSLTAVFIPGESFPLDDGAASRAPRGGELTEEGGVYRFSAPFFSGKLRRGAVQFCSEKPIDQKSLELMKTATEYLTLRATELAVGSAGEYVHNPAVISLRGIRKTYGTGGKEAEVLRGIDLDIYDGELLVILGASGTGKTTLLNIIGGLDKPTSGSITVDGVDIAKASDRKLTKYRCENVGFVFQFYSLMPNLTAAENLRYISELLTYKMTVREALTLVGLWDKRSSFPSQLSSGQQQRVAIARALIKRPKFILADEPTGALDLKTSKEVLSAMEKVVSEGQSTVVIITHNPEICKMADRVVYMRQGEISDIYINTNKLPAERLNW